MRLQHHQLRAYSAHLKSGGKPEDFVMPAPLPRKKRSNEESQMQRALITWWQRQCRVFGVPELALFSIPNGGARSVVTGATLKAEGARKGVPDLLLAVARAWSVKDALSSQAVVGFHGLFLELKRRDGRLSPEQEVFHKLLRQQGYKVVVCWSLTEAINEITTYLTK